jgi:hypothetical protein
LVDFRIVKSTYVQSILELNKRILTVPNTLKKSDKSRINAGCQAKAPADLLLGIYYYDFS